MPKRKTHFMNSALSIPQTFSYALDAFQKKHCVCFCHMHLSNLAVRNEFTKLFFRTCSRYCWNYCHFMEMEDQVQPIGLGFITMHE